MPTFEDFRPELKPCVTHSEGSKLIIEEEETHRHYVLPVDTLPIVDLLDGNHSIRDIVTELHEHHQKFRFASLFDTIQQLKDARFIENPEKLDIASGKTPTIFDKGHELLNRLRWSRVLLPKIEIPFHSLRAFYGLAAIVFICSLLSLLTDSYFRIPNGFASYHGSYARGIGVLILASAFLMSARSVILSLLQILATGRCYGISVRLLRFSLHLGVTDSAIYLKPGRKIATVFHLASLASFTAISGLLEIWMGKAGWFPDFKTVAIFLTLLEMSPYIQSDVQKIFRLFQPDDLLPHLIPYLRNRSLFSVFGMRQKLQHEFHLGLYASFALAWSLGSLYFCLLVLQKNYPNLIIAADDLERNYVSQLCALFALMGLVISSAYFLFDVLATLALNLYYPVAGSIQKARSRVTARDALNMDPTIIKALLKRNPLFEPMAEPSIDSLISQGWVRDYPRGTHLIIQGSGNHAIFAVLSGRVRITKREPTGAKVHVAELNPGSSVGEISAIYDRPATADVVAAEPVRAIVIHKKHLSALGEDYERIVGRVMLSHFLSSSPLFNSLPQEIVHVFVNEGKTQKVAPGTFITHQGSLEKAFYLVIHGKVDVHVNDSLVKTLGQGDFCGEISLIADVPRTASVIAVEETVLLRIDADVFWRVLAANIRLSLFIERIAEIRANETHLIGEVAAS